MNKPVRTKRPYTRRAKVVDSQPTDSLETGGEVKFSEEGSAEYSSDSGEISSDTGTTRRRGRRASKAAKARARKRRKYYYLLNKHQANNPLRAEAEKKRLAAKKMKKKIQVLRDEWRRQRDIEKNMIAAQAAKEEARRLDAKARRLRDEWKDLLRQIDENPNATFDVQQSMEVSEDLDFDEFVEEKNEEVVEKSSGGGEYVENQLNDEANTLEAAAHKLLAKANELRDHARLMHEEQRIRKMKEELFSKLEIAEQELHKIKQALRGLGRNEEIKTPKEGGELEN